MERTDTAAQAEQDAARGILPLETGERRESPLEETCPLTPVFRFGMLSDQRNRKRSRKVLVSVGFAEFAELG